MNARWTRAHRFRPRGARRRGFSLVEIIVAAALFTIVMMGVGSAYVVFQRSQFTIKERQAAQLAAQSMIEEIDTYVALNADNWDPDGTDTDITAGTRVQEIYDGYGFDVYNASYAAASGGEGQIGRGYVLGGLATGNTLKPAAASQFPDSRASATAAVQAMSGYVEVSQVGTRDLMQVHVVIAWKTYGGDTRVSYTTMLGPRN